DSLALALTLLSCPTRRSSDLSAQARLASMSGLCGALALFVSVTAAFVSVRVMAVRGRSSAHRKDSGWRPPPRFWSCGRARASARSEEHTSELQSRFDLVCRLL